MAKDQPTRGAAAAPHVRPEEERTATEAPLTEALLAAGEAAAARPRAANISGVAIGLLAGIDERGALVDFADNPSDEPIVARATLALGAGDVGREVALLFEGGDPARPVLMGLVHQPQAASLPVAPPAEEPEATADGERLVFTAEKEIVLRCGEASITLTRAGKVLIKGAYVLARSSGVNRIQGGSVLIN
jgi:hypothetical protein